MSWQASTLGTFHLFIFLFPIFYSQPSLYPMLFSPQFHLSISCMLNVEVSGWMIMPKAVGTVTTRDATGC
jgi:hypothetical protein